MTTELRDQLSKTEIGRLMLEVMDLKTAMWDMKLQMAKDRVWFSILTTVALMFSTIATSVVTAAIVKRI